MMLTPFSAELIDDYIMEYPYLAISHPYPTLSMGYHGPK